MNLLFISQTWFNRIILQRYNFFLGYFFLHEWNT